MKKKTERYAVDIEWDIDEEYMDEVHEVPLPQKILIPENMSDEEEISDYITNETGLCHKGFRIVSEFIRPANAGKLNTGEGNLGNKNSGSYNKGDDNTGFYNAGDANTGGHNDGDNNTGCQNNGDSNAGDMNIGDGNTGIMNVGDKNTGDNNIGNANAGNFNIGDGNTGHFNLGDYHTGCFNTEDTQSFTMFNQPSGWTMEEFITSEAYHTLLDMPSVTIFITIMTEDAIRNQPNAEITCGYLRQRSEDELAAARQQWWARLPETDKENIKGIPNFDPAIFKQITGIEV